MDLFDEFGNYIGPEEQENAIVQPEIEQEFNADAMVVDLPLETDQIVLHEQKSYYPSAQQVYGPDVQIVVQQEDTQALDQPIIAPLGKKRVQVSERRGIPETRYSLRYMIDILGMPGRVRNVALLGSLHAGKTSLIDMFVEYSHSGADQQRDNPSRYADCLYLERERGITLKTKTMSFVLPNSKGKSHYITLIDTPGHSAFLDEAVAALHLADGALLVVDPVEGLTWHTEQLLRLAVGRGMKIVLFLNKLDRLFLELKLAPNDAYQLLKYTVDQVNTCVKNMGHHFRFEPENNNVIFGCAKDKWTFTCESFASLYPESFMNSSKYLWGDVYCNEAGIALSGTKNMFVTYILEPIYKLYVSVIQFEGEQLVQRLQQAGIRLKKSDLKKDVKDLLHTVLKSFFGERPIECFVDCVVQFLDSPISINSCSSSANDAGENKSSANQDQLVFSVLKVFGREAEIATPHSTINSFFALGKVVSGTIRRGQSVKLLGAETSPIGIIEEIFIFQSRYQLTIDTAPCGSVVAILLSASLQSHLSSVATIVDVDSSLATPIKIEFPSNSTIRLSIQPMVPAELPKMVDGLRKIALLYPALEVRVEESGEHIVAAGGELYLDCVMYDLRINYGELEVKVSQPMVKFCETVIETSNRKCNITTPNHRNSIAMICGPLSNELVEDVERGGVKSFVKSSSSKTVAEGNFDLLKNKELSRLLQSKYSWDILEARNLWSFGPDFLTGPNVLIDDCIPDVTDKASVELIKQSIILGFQWACREGPLCESPVRSVKFRLIDAVVSSDPAHRSGSQIIPTCRRACYAAMLSASPRLLEPIGFVEIQTISECISSIYALLAKRRGHVIREVARGGTPFFFLHALIPIIDSFGFETDLRIISQGQAFCHQSFSHWDVVPGDPLDSSLEIRPLEPSDPVHMARDFVLKSRKRKGLSLDITPEKYFE